MKFSNKLVKAKFIKRYKRFFSEHILEDGTTVIAHCANTGAMKGLNKEGITSWLLKNDNPKRKLKWSWELCQINKTYIGINTHNPNRIIEEALKNKTINQLKDYSSFKREVKYGENSKIDFLLNHSKNRDCYLEIKNVHLSRKNKLAEFPDSVTERGKKHMTELAKIKQKGYRAVILYLIQRNDCDKFGIAKDIDSEYYIEFCKAIKIGVEVICVDTILNQNEIKIGKQLKFVNLN